MQVKPSSHFNMGPLLTEPQSHQLVRNQSHLLEERKNDIDEIIEGFKASQYLSLQLLKDDLLQLAKSMQSNESKDENVVLEDLYY